MYVYNQAKIWFIDMSNILSPRESDNSTESS